MQHLYDAPLSNVLALAGIVFLAVAVLGRVSGLLGKIFGAINADLPARLLSGALGLALVTGGIVLHLRADSQEAVRHSRTRRADAEPVSKVDSPSTAGHRPVVIASR